MRQKISFTQATIMEKNFPLFADGNNNDFVECLNDHFLNNP